MGRDNALELAAKKSPAGGRPGIKNPRRGNTAWQATAIIFLVLGENACSRFDKMGVKDPEALTKGLFVVKGER